MDDQLFWMLHDARALQRKPRDRTWLRLIDVPNALSSRTYAMEDEIVFEVRDQFCPWNEGVYHLVGGPSGATCRPTNKSPDLALSVDDLAVPYLGGFPSHPWPTPAASRNAPPEHSAAPTPCSPPNSNPGRRC